MKTEILNVARDSLAFSFVEFNCYPECKPPKDSMPWTKAMLFPCGYFFSSSDGTKSFAQFLQSVHLSGCCCCDSCMPYWSQRVFRLCFFIQTISWQNHFRPVNWIWCTSREWTWSQMKNYFQEQAVPQRYFAFLRMAEEQMLHISSAQWEARSYRATVKDSPIP